MAASFAGGNQVMGAPKTADFLEKATWVLIGMIALLSILAVGVSKGQQSVSVDESQITNQVQEAAESMQMTAPAADFDAEAGE